VQPRLFGVFHALRKLQQQAVGNQQSALMVALHKQHQNLQLFLTCPRLLFNLLAVMLLVMSPTIAFFA
jgi:hypothetical protein